MATPTSPHNPVDIVSDAYATYKDLALDMIDETKIYLEKIAEYPLPEIPLFEVDFPDIDTSIPDFQLPAPPEVPDTTLEMPQPPPAITIESPPSIDTSGLPTLTVSEPSLSLPPVPDALDVSLPVEPSPPAEIELPTLTDPVLPTSPTLFTLTLPDAPVLNIPTFDDPIPDFELDFDVGTFNYNETLYDSAMLATLRARITAMINGGTGLPVEVETALFDRARTREASVNLAAQQTSLEEWSSRGFTMPGGDITRRLAEIREARRTAENTLQRDVMVQVHTAALEQLKAGVSSGVELEGQLMNYYAGFADRQLRAAVATVELSVSSLNGRIAFFNAKLARIDLAARVFETRVRAALATIEVYKAQIEGERVRGEINVQQIQLYQSQINAALSLIEVYRAKLEGARVQTEVERNKIETYKARVDAFGAVVQAKRTEYDGYSTAVQAEVAKTGIYETTVRAYAARVDAYGKRVTANVEATRAFTEAERLKVEQQDSRIRSYVAQVEAERSRIGALADVYESSGRVFAAQASAEESRISAISKKVDLEVAAGRAETDLQLTKMTSQAQIAIQASAQAIEAMKAVSSVQIQLAAGAMSAVNTGAAISGQDTFSISYEGQI